MRRNKIDSQKWIKKAEKQTLKTLSKFITEVIKEFPSWCDYPNLPPQSERTLEWYESDEAKECYQNGMISGALCLIATSAVMANQCAWSCNQAGVVRNVAYQSFFDSDKIDLNVL